eukprot:CAMPEP_0201489524 /NCGR_PEP_ID=MMETSP0151_2-20130828/22855_1 /ASSEMBLY_ACC=CAM_ASM_000257 /TAXON_ID=200890 /ORGANISM="Paramoeba atlantica, Strain 621/1 / CCAP 1560/9" /LENGTH=553 /DNA_ID=CAMNT_0047875145 /DNA_START=115 /DNA_END=1776 /DNA_ORIENTATION=+
MVSTVFVFVAFLAALAPLHASQFNPQFPEKDWDSVVTVYLETGGVFEPVVGKDDISGGVAVGRFKNTLEEAGWGILEVETNSNYADNDQMFAAGMAEGRITAHRILEHYWNIMDIFYPGQLQPDEDILQFLSDNLEWMDQQIQQNAATDPFWEQVGFMRQQLNGLVNGTQLGVSPYVPSYYLTVLNAVGDLIDLTNAVNLTNLKMNPVSEWSEERLRDYIHKSGHCSAFIRLTGAYEDLFMAHSSWFAFQSMNRIYKHYNFRLNSPSNVASQLSFSSYPGFLESLDDFYLLNSGLVMLQTTNNIFNMTLYDYVVPQSLLAWVRVRVANAMATGGSTWYSTVKRYNSGTYNNQYMVIDTSKFTPEFSMGDDGLWVIEQIPSLVMGADVTPILRTGYWSSYNIPFFETIYNMSGYPEVVEQYGTDYSYQLAPRAKIFRRDNCNVTDLTSLAWMMRYNDYEVDPYAGGDPWGAVCSRGDLTPLSGVAGTPSPNGCYDSKITDFQNAKQLKSFAINGPTNEQQPTFTWKDTFPKAVHLGQPETFDFDWYTMQPSWHN